MCGHRHRHVATGKLGRLGRLVMRCILVAATLALPAIHAQDDDKAFASLEGRVVNAATGEPIHKAVVRLSVHGARRVTGLIGSTDTEGRFRFKRVTPGDYNLAAHKNGFLERSHGSVLALKAGDHLKDIVLRLSPAGAISGRVVDEDGDPVAGADVRLWHGESFLGQNRLERLGGTESRTNGRGEYRFDGLGPGRYFVRATPDKDAQPSLEDRIVDSKGDPALLREVPTYYPNALLVDDASPVHVAAGEEQGGIDVRLRRSKTFRISGKVVGFDSMILSDLRLYINRVEGRTLWALGELKPSANGEFSVDKLLPGTYELSLYHAGINIRGKARVELTSADQTEVPITPYKPAQVKLRVAVEGRERKPSEVVFGYLRRNPLDFGAWCHLENGVCVFGDVEPGRYTLDFQGSVNGYVKSVQSGDKRLNARAIDVPEGGLALDVVLSEAMARIDGDVTAEEAKQDGEGQDKTPVGVVLVPVTTGEELPALPRTTSPDQYGHFSFRDLRPGKYRLFAARGVDYSQWSNPDFVRELESNDTEVELREKDILHVRLKPIPEQEMSRIRKKLGLE